MNIKNSILMGTLRTEKKVLHKLLSGDNQTKLESYTVRRVAFDIGSLTTKMIVADVDRATGTIQAIILKDVRHVGYRADIEREGGDGSISQDMLQEGIKALKELKALADSLMPLPQEYAAVATASLRKATNGAQVAHELYRHTGIPVFIVDQQEEARLGFNGVLHTTGFSADETVVWDMGGGSTQFIYHDDTNILRIVEGEESFVPFTNYVIQTIQKTIQKKSHTNSPNPLSAPEAKKAIAYATQQADLLVPEDLRKKLQKPTTRLVAIGALYYATYELNPTSSTRRVLEEGQIEGLLNSKLDKTDYELASSTHKALTPAVAATSLALLLGYLKAFGDTTLYTAEVNMTDGLLVSSHYFAKPVLA